MNDTDILRVCKVLSRVVVNQVCDVKNLFAENTETWNRADTWHKKFHTNLGESLHDDVQPFDEPFAERVQHWLKLIIDFVTENSDVFESWGLDSDGAKSFRVLLYGKSFFDDNQTAIRTRELSQRCGRVANNALIYSSYSSSLALIWTHARNFSKGF